MKIIPVINCVCAWVRTSAEDNFPRKGEGNVYLIILFESFYVLVCQKKTLFQVIWGLLGISIRSIL